MRKKRFFTSSFAALCLLSAAVQGQPLSAHEEYLQFAQNEDGEIHLDDGRTLFYTVKSRSKVNGVEIIRAQVDDPALAEFMDYSSFIVTLDHDKQEMSGYLETGSGQFRLQSSSDGNENVFWRKIKSPKMDDRILKNPDTSFMRRFNQEAAGEKDASGRYVIDVFIGFSEQAAQDVGNINTEAQIYVESVNEALNNSQIEGVYLRLVGVGVSPQNPGVVTSVLRDGKEWFKEDIERYAPDLIGLVQRPTDAPGSAGGWGNVPGDIVVIGAPWPGAYRHEVGHNVGGMHCKSEGDTGYNYGFSVRQGRGTAQCGNDLSYYSSPLIMDDEGNVLGTTHSHDMARLWRERSAAMSANRIHKVPFPGETGGRYRMQNYWRADQFLHMENGGLESGAIEQGWWSAQWDIKAVGQDDYVRICNRWRAQACMNVEDGGLQAGAIESGWHSAQWKLEPVEGQPDLVRIRNRWKPNQYLHIENGTPEAGPVQPGWFSARWKLTSTD
ncbi:hypothetical protein [Hahella sp. NBU794]|uniref:RICIN domain-containing protein n=1 Tax=Hahella sp. NBU794 TaxID=3422590 RepID=UPI003D6ECD73